MAKSGLPSAGAIILRAWDNYLHNFKPLMRVAGLLLAAVPFTLPLALAGTAGISPYGQLIEADRVATPGYLFLTALMAAVTLLILIIVRPALNAVIYAQLLDHRLKTRDALEFGARQWKRYVPTMLVLGLGLGLGFTLWFIPGLIALIYFLFTEQAVVLEEKTMKSAFRRSLELIRGRFWAVFWRMLAASAVFGLGIAVLTVLTIQMPLALLRGAAVDPTSLKLVITPFILLGTVIGAAAMPLSLSVQVILFAELKKLKK